MSIRLETNIFNEEQKNGISADLQLESSQVSQAMLNEQETRYDEGCLNGEQNERSEVSVDVERSPWSPQCSLMNAQSKDTWSMCAFHARGVVLNHERLKQMCSSYVNACREHGFHMVDPTDCTVLELNGRSRIDVFEEYLLDAVERDCSFVIALIPREDKELHLRMKLFEQAYEIITQSVHLNTMIAATGLDGQDDELILKNIVNKTYMKFGGIIHWCAI
ncbi:hypothetical protein M3Y94_00693200 [Aphelenchoides besseyi]|nr:hypothetical protein M3Y94_00693200 [Aphelenchoides besseyi]